MSSYTLGIDPGIKGAVSLLNPDGKCVWVKDAPLCKGNLSYPGMYEMIYDAHHIAVMAGYGELRAFIEEPKTMRGRSKGLLTSGINMGVWLGILIGFNIEYTRVSVHDWQRGMLKGVHNKGKSRARFVAESLFPGADLGKRKTEDRSDALLLAEYGRRLRGGEMREGE